MSHITCPKCNSAEHITGYGFAAGPLGSYTICECGVLLEFYPDMDAAPLDDTGEYKKDIDTFLKAWRAEVWPADTHNIDLPADGELLGSATERAGMGDEGKEG